MLAYWRRLFGTFGMENYQFNPKSWDQLVDQSKNLAVRIDKVQPCNVLKGLGLRMSYRV